MPDSAQGKNQWYTRSAGIVRGPFPAGLVTRYILLGRLRETDEVSNDGRVWQSIAEVPALIPDVMKGDSRDPHAHDRLAAARRWADERTGRDRRDRQAPPPPEVLEKRTGRERRTPEPALSVLRRLARAEHAGERPASPVSAGSRWPFYVVIAFLCAAAAGVALFVSPAQKQPGAVCGAPPAPKIDWSNCRKEGARLAGVDLSGARLNSTVLTGADLRGGVLRGGDFSYATFSLADLDQADFRAATLVGANFHRAKLTHVSFAGADISYADLQGARIDGADFSGAQLTNTLWIDGSVCAPGSVGRCVPLR